MSYGMKYVNTADLKVLIRRANRYGFNRQIDKHVPLDPDGTHVIDIVLAGHNMDRTDVLLHHRCRVMMKFKDRDDPQIAFIDVADVDYRKLTPVEDHPSRKANVSSP